MAKIDYIDTEELAAYLLGLDDDYDTETIDEALTDKYEISFDQFHKIVELLIPLCEVAKSPITGVVFRGFADRKEGFWLVKITD